jgi:hypothetical protein
MAIAFPAGGGMDLPEIHARTFRQPIQAAGLGSIERRGSTKQMACSQLACRRLKEAAAEMCFCIRKQLLKSCS